jgi:hypothetical protein
MMCLHQKWCDFSIETFIFTASGLLRTLAAMSAPCSVNAWGHVLENSCLKEPDGADGAGLAFGGDPVESVEGFFRIGERRTEQHPKPPPALEGRPDGFVVVELAGKVLWARIFHCDWQATQILSRLPVCVWH